ncbi:protein of unknown function [Nocardioides scoriae]|uniref:DUF4185 domain-containing protein n=1 Tax=Nocardioides scoriae TaxID=642780 RepID=A0A1H1QQJ7_9ACTN|nr:DUF4185 domain-containing protein [Nocardioides scoriae]SDS25675.1 protein of unknown function [Nocardioides scoriae]
MPRRYAGPLVVALLLVPVVLLLVHAARATPRPHEVPVAVQAPAVVADAVVARLDALAGSPVRARAIPEDADPREPLRQGTAAAVVVVDLRVAQDVLLVPAVGDPELTRLLEGLSDRVGTPLGRTSRTVEVAPVRDPSLGRGALAASVGAWVLVGVLVGVAAGLVVPLLRRRRGRAAPSVRVRVARVLLVAGLAGVAAGLVVALVASWQGGLAPGAVPAWWLLGAGVVAATALATAGLEAVGGPWGTAVAGLLVLALTGPLVTGRDPRVLPEPWPVLAGSTVHGAGLALARATAWTGGLPAGSVLLLLLVAVLGVGLLAWDAARSAGRPATPADQPRRLPLLGALGVPLAVAALGATLLAPRQTDGLSAAPVARAAQTECLEVPDVSDLAGLNRFAGRVRGGPSFQGADVGADVRLQDGRRLWVFGDTLRSASFRGQRFVRNSMLVFGPGCVRSVLPADGGALVPDRADGVGYWPMSVARVQRPGYDLVGVATQRVRSTEAPDGAGAFDNLGPSMAVFVVPRGGTPQLVEQRDLGPDSADPARPEWGAAAVVRGGWVYLYGTARPDTPGVFGFSLRVARTRPEQLLRQRSWRYWDGERWQADPDRAGELVPARGGVSQTLSVFPRGDRWYAVSKRDEFLGTDLVVWSAPSPTGPFDGGTTVARIPSDVAAGELRYMPLAHPDLLPEPGSVVVSYSRNDTDVAAVEADPFRYRPAFLRVPLPAAGAR